MSLMAGVIKSIPRVAIFLVGMAAGAIAGGRRGRAPKREIGELKETLAELESRVRAHERDTGIRFDQLEAKVNQHESRLAEMPSTEQIVGAMERLLAKTMTSLDERLAAQSDSIDVLKTTVSQTDELLERVIESIDALQPVQDGATNPEM
jgi:chromosome segregation ATPase